MASRSALISVMNKASLAASRRMMRDFGEVENLQVSRKGAADFVSQADITAERVLREELEKARPGWAFIMEEGGQVAGELRGHLGLLGRDARGRAAPICRDGPRLDQQVLVVEALPLVRHFEARVDEQVRE